MKYNFNILLNAEKLNEKNKCNIFLPEMKGASGGAKVIYKHSNIINNLDQNFSSQILHLKRNIIYKFEASLAKRLSF